MGDNPLGESLGGLHVVANMGPQPLSSVASKHEPQLERPESPPEGHLPVPIVDDLTRVAGRVAQVLGYYRKSFDEWLAVCHVERRAIEVCE